MHTINIPTWATKKARHRVERLDPQRTALLVIDMQTGLIDPGPMGNPHAADIVPNINSLAGAARDAGAPVIFIRHTVSDEPRYRLPTAQAEALVRAPEGWRLFDETWPGHDVHPAMDRRPTDTVINKHRISAFTHNSSDLHDILQSRGVDVVIVTGTVTNVCCETTARDAYQLGYDVVFVSDATAARTDEEHNASLLNVMAVFGDVRDTAGTMALLRS